jgi:hypothetical protein
MSPKYTARVRTHPQSPAESNHTRNDAADYVVYLSRPRAGMLTEQHSRIEPNLVIISVPMPGV